MIQFTIKHKHGADDRTCCSYSCSFYSYEAATGCRAGCADGKGHPTDACPGDGVFTIVEVEE